MPFKRRPLTFNTIRKRQSAPLCSAFREQSHRAGLTPLEQLQFSSYKLSVLGKSVFDLESIHIKPDVSYT